LGKQAWVLPILVDRQMSFGKPILTHAYLPEMYLSAKPSFMFAWLWTPRIAVVLQD
jgi:hypothetical protein